MSGIIQIAVGVALAPVVFALGLAVLRGASGALRELPYFWGDHPNIAIALCCGAFALVLSALR